MAAILNDPGVAVAVGCSALALLIVAMAVICTVTVAPPPKARKLRVRECALGNLFELRKTRAGLPGEIADEPCTFDGTRGFVSSIRCRACSFDMYRKDAAQAICVWCGTPR